MCVWCGMCIWWRVCGMEFEFDVLRWFVDDR